MRHVRMSFDGSCVNNPGGPGGWGYVVEGLAIGRCADRGHYLADPALTNNVAEYGGLISGLEFLLSVTDLWDRATVIGDSKMVIEQAAGRWKCKKPHLQKLLAKANKTIDGIGRFRLFFQWVPREENQECDDLSKGGGISAAPVGVATCGPAIQFDYGE